MLTSKSWSITTWSILDREYLNFLYSNSLTPEEVLTVLYTFFIHLCQAGPLRAERRRRKARREIFSPPGDVTARRPILGPPAEGQPGPSHTKRYQKNTFGALFRKTTQNALQCTTVHCNVAPQLLTTNGSNMTHNDPR